ncbi:hypothetical protein DL765_008218 [Monosporascus sp. GIB2]|nr:hypothetical protein DL765_008218 [Monosporascus sp. GIB2]
MPPRTLSTSGALSVLAHSAKPELSARQCVARPGQQQCTASFSTTTSREALSVPRRMFLEFMNTVGRRYRRHTPGETNYVQPRGMPPNDNMPFPINPLFRSRPVLDDKARELIWEKIMRNGETIKAVSAELGVDIRRVAAVVRLKEVEKDWEAKGKKLAKPYAKAILEMLPTRTFKAGMQNTPFEPINELHVHPYTMQQLFWPTSESRHFTREDAAKAFHEKLLSADKRVPHPELIQMERELAEGSSQLVAARRFKDAVMESERKAAEKQVRKALAEEKSTTRVQTKRFEFRFKEINSELVGPKGKARSAVGWRYGAPYYDRAKGQIKIPTSVP